MNSVDLGRVEIGHQAVDGLEPIAGGDEDRGIAVERLDDAVFVRRAFEQAQRGGADRDDPSARRAHGVESLGGVGVDPAPFGVHDMVVGIVGLDRQERPCPDMQRQRFRARFPPPRAQPSIPA